MKEQLIPKKLIGQPIDSMNSIFPVEKELIKDHPDSSKTYQLIIARRGYGLYTPSKYLKDWEGKSYIEMACVLDVKADENDRVTLLKIMQDTVGYEQQRSCLDVFDFYDDATPIDRKSEALECKMNPFIN